MFDVGTIVPSKLSIKKAQGLGIDLMTVLQCHVGHEWPDLTPYEKALNLIAIENKRVVYARYKIKSEIFIIITDLREDRTTISMIEEL